MNSLNDIFNETIIGAIVIGCAAVVLWLIIMVLYTIITNHVLLPTIILVLLSWIAGKKTLDYVDKKNKERGF